MGRMGFTVALCASCLWACAQLAPAVEDLPSSAPHAEPVIAPTAPAVVVASPSATEAPAAVEPAAAPAGPTAPAGSAALAALPWPERIELERAIAENDPVHAPTLEEGAPTLAATGVTASFASGARLSIAGHTATLRAVSLGRGASRAALADVPGTIAGAEVRAERAPGVTEWWRSLPSGLEHGVTIAERPPGNGELTLDLEISGLGTRSAGDDAIELTAGNGSVVATYAHLVVADARGVRLPATMRASSAGMTIAVDDASGTYPLVIDPLVVAYEASLLDDGSLVGSAFGSSVAITADGTRAIVGAPFDDTAAGIDAGSAYVLTRSGTTWTREARLVALDAEPGDRLGHAVAVSADGGRALVGAPGDDVVGATEAGNALVFVRNGTIWALEATLPAPDGRLNDQLGWSVALNADGSSALVGARWGEAARVFGRTGAAWTLEATLRATAGLAGDLFGSSVALTGDGSRALVGAQLDDTGRGVDVGTAHVFLRSGTTWLLDATLVAPDGAAGDMLGGSVAIAVDGSRAVVGVNPDFVPFGPRRNVGAYVFRRTGAAWTAEATLLAPDTSSADEFGASLGVSADASRVVVGAPADTTVGGMRTGSARVFSRSGTVWTSEATWLAPDGASGDALGEAVALTADGTGGLVGALLDLTSGGAGAGSARYFVRSVTTWAQEAMLVAPELASADGFGASVALSGDALRAVVGADGDDTTRTADGGSARVFARLGTTWATEGVLLASDGAPGDGFGRAVALSADGNRALVGAEYDDTTVADVGSVHVFFHSSDGWSEEATLAASSGAAGARFGCAVALDMNGNRALIGSIGGRNVSGGGTGNARVFLRTGTNWGEEASLFPPDGFRSIRFGDSVALSADGARALVGAPADDTTDGVGVGTVYVFRRVGTAWSVETVLTASDAQPGDSFGTSVALAADGLRALVGVDQDDLGSALDVGSARVFAWSGTAWTEEATLSAPDGASNDFRLS